MQRPVKLQQKPATLAADTQKVSGGVKFFAFPKAGNQKRVTSDADNAIWKPEQLQLNDTFRSYLLTLVLVIPLSFE